MKCVPNGNSCGALSDSEIDFGEVDEVVVVV